MEVLKGDLKIIFRFVTTLYFFNIFLKSQCHFNPATGVILTQFKAQII